MRTLEDLQRVAEQILDAQVSQKVTPKQAEQLNMTHKALRWPVEVWLRYKQMVMKHKGNVGPIPDDAPPAVRQIFGMPALPPKAPRQ